MWKHAIIIILLVVFIAAAAIFSSEAVPQDYLKKVDFKLLAADGKVIANQQVNIGRIAYFQLSDGQVTAYLDSKSELVITTVKTDSKGGFFLNLGEIWEQDIVIQPIWGYEGWRFSRSKDLSGTYSKSHIKVYEPWNKRNVIYDLKNKTARAFLEDGGMIEFEFDIIKLRLKKSEMMELIESAADSWDEIELGKYCAFNKLVEMGDDAAVYMLQWLKLHKPQGEGMIKIAEPGYQYILKALSLTTCRQAKDLICRSSFVHQKQKCQYLKHLEIWDHDDQLSSLINSWNNNGVNRKWILFRLAKLRDYRAVGFLQKVANDCDGLDLRITAKKALECIQNPEIQMEYRFYKFEERLKLEPLKKTYKLGEPIEAKCTITGGEYGSRHLVEFSDPWSHFLPWAVKDNNEIKVYRLRIYVTYDDNVMKQLAEKVLKEIYPEPNETYYQLLEGIKRGDYTKYVDPDGGIELAYVELEDIKKAFWDFQPLDNYITIDDLGEQQEFILGPGANREYIIDLNDGFLLDLPCTTTTWIGLVEGHKMHPCSEKVTFRIIEDDKN